MSLSASRGQYPTSWIWQLHGESRLRFKFVYGVESYLLHRNVEEIVKDAYAWLAGKYQEGDQIYLFGWFGSLNNVHLGHDKPVRFLSGCISSQDSCRDDIRGKVAHYSPVET